MKKNNNLKLAEDYCKKIAGSVKEYWASDNLPEMSSEERRAILKVYKRHFHTVEYDSDSGICKCWVKKPNSNVDVNKSTMIFNSFDKATGIAGSSIKQSTLDHLGVEDYTSGLDIVDSDKMPERTQ